MTRDNSVLERNLRALLARSYVSVTPRDAFRERLRVRCLALVAAPARTRRAWPRLLAVAIPAAAALALLLWWPSRERPEAADAILARGLVAMRTAEGGEWQGVPGDPVRLSEPYLELRTGARGARVPVTDTGSLALAPESAMIVHTAARELTAQLDRGALGVERRTGPGSWRVTTSEGDVEIAHGALSLTHRASGGVLVVLREGAAWVPDSPGRRDLAAGVEVLLRGGKVIELPTGAASAAAGEPRTSLPPGAAPDEVPAGASAGGCSVDGQVKDAATLAPLADFRVTLLREEPLPRVAEPIVREFTGTGGEFAVDGMAPGLYAVFVQAEGYAVWSARHVMLKGENPAEVEAALERGASLRGYVLDALTRRPLAGALVVSENDTPAQLLPVVGEDVPEGFTASALTLFNGSFEIDHLSPGPHVLRASAVGHGPSWSAPIVVEPGVDRDGIVLRLGAGGSIRGKVTEDDGTPRTGVVVVASLLDASGLRYCMTYGITVTDAAGQFEIGDLATGNYSVVDLGENGRDRLKPQVVAAQVVAGQSTTLDFSGRLSGARLHGRVINARGDVDGYSVAVMQVGSEDRLNGWRGAGVAADGTYQMTGLPAGRYYVSAGRGMGPSQTLQGEVDLASGADVEFDVVLGSCELQGHVHDADGAKVADPILVLERVGEDGAADRFAAKSHGDGSGHYLFAGVRPGLYRLTCFASRSSLAQESIEDLRVAENELEHTVDFVLSPGGDVHIAVTDAQGRAAAGTAVEFVDERNRKVQMSASDVTDAAGKLVVYGVKPGRWRIAGRKENARSQVQEVTVRAGETVEVALALEP
jgi:hypothetical protein